MTGFLFINPKKKDIMDLFYLVKKAQNGDQLSFNKLIISLTPVIRNAVNSFFKGDMAEDAVQETYLKIWNNIHTFDPLKSKSVRSWVKTITTRCCIDIRRSESRRKTDLMDDIFVYNPKDEDAIYIEIACNGNNPEEKLKNAELISYVIYLLGNKLSEKQKDMVYAMHIEGKNQKEIAEEFNTTPTNVGAIICRAMNILKTALADHKKNCKTTCVLH
jgi:RNA polymerase sigma-70 factor, ECF subfamily